MPPIVLIGVVLMALSGRAPGPTAGPRSGASPGASVEVVAAKGAEASHPAVTPSPRSDWPAAIGHGQVLPLLREEGTDGLMGRLPFGPPNDTPNATPTGFDFSKLDDERASWSADRAASPDSRRLGGLSNYRVDPYER